MSREMGTLDPRNMSKLGSDMSRTAYEFSHVTYFPNLLFHAIHAQLKGRN